jgi:tRNA(Ile)-lysidine synthetase-like protein
MEKDIQIYNEIYNFWFDNQSYWFGCHTEFDNLIRYKYKRILLDQLQDNNLYQYPNHQKIIFTKILLCDQFSRHIFRNNKETISLYDIKANELFTKYDILNNIEKYEKPEERCFLLMPLRHSFELKNIYICLELIHKWIQEHYHKIYERFIKASCKKIYELNKEKIIHYNSSNLNINSNLNNNTQISYENILDKNAYQNLNNLQKINKDNKLKQLFEKNMKQYIKNNCLKITVSISGGVDSCVCLYLLHDYIESRTNQKNNINFTFQINAFMVNYTNRYEQNIEKEFVNDFCNKLNMPFYVRNITELKRTTLKDRAFYEQYTKNIRYDCYKNLGNIIILGHNLDDCMENIINNIKKNINYNNLKGMEIFQEEKENNVSIFRPLLDIKKQEILEFAHKHNIPYAYDSTSSLCERGKIRDQFIPFINNYDKNIYSGLLELSNNYYEIYKIYENVFPKIIFDEQKEYQNQNNTQNEQKNIIISIENLNIYFFDYWKRIFSHICKKLEIHYIKNKSIHNFILNMKKQKSMYVILSKDLKIKNNLTYFEINYLFI